MLNNLLMQTYEHIDIAMKKNFTQENLSRLLDMFVKFPQMPYYNLLLILRQKPKATLICGRQAWDLYGGEIVDKNPIILLCPEFTTVEDTDNDNGSLLGKTGQLDLKAVTCYDVSQVKIDPEKSNALISKTEKPNFIDALRRHGSRVQEDDINNPKLKHALIKSKYDYDSSFLLINPRITPEEKQKEALKAFVERYIYVNYRNNEAIAPEIGTYISELQDYTIEILERYYGIAETFEVTPSDVFSETSIIQGAFLRELSNTIFTLIQYLEGKSSLTFNETMFCNTFLETPDRKRVLEVVNEMLDKTFAHQLVQDLISFRDIFISESTISDESIAELHRKKQTKELFTFPSKVYTYEQ